MESSFGQNEAATLVIKAPATRKEIFSWAFFDFANSSFTTVVITAVYSRFFISHIVPANSSLKDTYWSMAMIAATLIGLVLSPFLGVVSDYGALKKKLLVAASLICSFATAALFFAEPGQVFGAMTCVVIASVGFMFSENFCASFLPEISTPKTMAKISGLGWGIGYFGGLASLVVVLSMVKSDPATQTAQFVIENRWAMVATGAFFIVAAMPTFLFLKSRGRPHPDYAKTSVLGLAKIGFKSFFKSLEKARSHALLFQFLVAFTIYMAGLDAVIKFVGIYASSELHFDNADITMMFLVLQVSAAAGAFVFGLLEQKAGAKRMVQYSLLLWIASILLIFMLPFLSEITALSQKHLFFGISLLAGTGLGATQSSSRTIVGLLAPEEESGEMFGYWGFFMKIATILGMLFGVLSDALDSRRHALLLVLGFFALGLALITRLNLPQIGKNSPDSPKAL